MASTCLDVITSALKLARVLRSGGTPSASETADGLSCLQSLYDSAVADGMFGKLEDIYLTADDTAQERKRYRLAAGVSLTEPATIAAEDSADGDERPVRDLAVYEKVDSTGVRTVRLYDRTGWVDLLGLASGDIAPLESRGAMGLAAWLATSGAFCAIFGDTASMNPDVRALATRFKASLSYKLGSSQDRRKAEYF
jgi:hypothetical protein